VYGRKLFLLEKGEMMSEEFDSREQVESSQESSRETQAITEMTNEPSTHVESTRTVEEAEAVETVFVEVVQAEVTTSSAEATAESEPIVVETLEAEVEQTSSRGTETTESREEQTEAPMLVATAVPIETETGSESVVVVEYNGESFQEGPQQEIVVQVETIETVEPPPRDSAQTESRESEQEEESSSEEEIPVVEVVEEIIETEEGIEMEAQVATELEVEPETLPIVEELAEVETGPEETLDMPEEGLLDQTELSPEAMEGVEEYWEPPEMYIHHGADGSKTVVGPDGKLLDSPPIITVMVDSSGAEIVRATYPGMGPNEYFEISSYEAPLDQGLYVYQGSDGKPVVVDGAGKPIDSPPIVQIAVDSSGKEIYSAKYPGAGTTQMVQLESYVGSFEKEMYVYRDSSGTPIVVGADGKAIDSPPKLNIAVDSTGKEIIMASYPGAGEEGKTFLSSYSAPLEGLYAHYGQDGTMTIVDADGKQVDSPPSVTKIINSKGQEQIIASYPGTGPEDKVTLQAYQPATTGGTFINIGSDGTPAVVDANGELVDSPPVIQMVMSSNAVTSYLYSYPGTNIKGVLSLYSAPLNDCYIHVGQDGTNTVVDADGKPLSSQPVLHKVVDSTGQEIISAWYPSSTGTETKVQLGYYKPPSGA
jgi:hypothetical protein